jgi:protein-S-isoprenylcysteine O-methyltransferase Ste14
LRPPAPDRQLHIALSPTNFCPNLALVQISSKQYQRRAKLMALKEQLEKQGNWLFKWRSYLPLVLLPLVLSALNSAEQFEHLVGDTAEDIYEFGCIIISFSGLAIRMLVIGYVPYGTSGRNTSEQRAEELNTKGIYATVRHPLYFGNFLIFLGIAMFIPVWWLVLVFCLCFFLYYERIMLAEEAFLIEKYGKAYHVWAEKTPAFIPKVGNWVRPDLTFSIRNILKREYPAFFAIIAAFTTFEFLGEIIGEGIVELELPWFVFFSFGLVTYLTLRTLKKKTRILHVEGR